MSFEIIDTQEKLDAVISERLRREREAVGKKYADYDDLKAKTAAYEEQIAELTKAAEKSAKERKGYDDTIAQLQGRIKGYETASVKTRIAHETGIPFELASRLTGDDEEAIRKDAEALAKFVKGKTLAPLRTEEKNDPDGKAEALRAFTAGLINND